jgi:hypothetical protein
MREANGYERERERKELAKKCRYELNEKKLKNK